MPENRSRNSAVAVPRPSPGARQQPALIVVNLPASDKGTSFSLAMQQIQEPNMEGLARLVSESLARHGFDRPLDYRRLHWSRWFRCESHHSLLFVPSKPGVFALAEEITHVAAAAKPALSVVEGAVPRSEASGRVETDALVRPASEASASAREAGSRKPEADSARRMLAVTQFFEADDMAFVLDRMLARQHPMRPRLESGRYFVRFVVIEDQSQRHGIANALNQWIASSAEKATGIGSHFATSLELTPATEFVPQDNVVRTRLERESKGPSPASAGSAPIVAASRQLDSVAATNIHCPSPFPSGF